MTSIKAIKDFSTSLHGNVDADQVLHDVPSGLASQWIEHGLAVEVAPGKSGSAAAARSSSQPAGQALPDGNANTYETKPEPLRPTQRSGQSRPAASSTPATAPGGDAITKKRKATKGGRKTRQRPETSD